MKNNKTIQQLCDQVLELLRQDKALPEEITGMAFPDTTFGKEEIVIQGMTLVDDVDMQKLLDFKKQNGLDRVGVLGLNDEAENDGTVIVKFWRKK